MNEDYYFIIGSITDCLIDKDISNEDMVGVIIDMKIIYSIITDQCDFNYQIFIESVYNSLHLYCESLSIIIKEWLYNLSTLKISRSSMNTESFIN